MSLEKSSNNDEDSSKLNHETIKEAPLHYRRQLIPSSASNILSQTPLISTSNSSDSAYGSLVCSPFSPPSTCHTTTTTPSRLSYTSSPLFTELAQRDRLSSTTPDDEIFNMSLEQIDNFATTPSITTITSSTRISNRRLRPNSVMFIPIDNYQEQNEDEDDNDEEENEDNIQNRRCNCYSRQNNSSLRSISTQTSPTVCPFGRPNSAPLNQYIANELSEMENGSITRNSTYTCIRSPMPDVIPPIHQQESHSLLASRLSIIADEIDNSNHNLYSFTTLRRHRASTISTSDNNNIFSFNSYSSTTPRTRQSRHRRLSTSALSEMSPAGASFIDFLYSLFNALKEATSSNQH